jgi:hypothetical protein
MNRLSALSPDGHFCSKNEHFNGSELSIRTATLADLDSMLEIGLEAMPLDPQWSWRFPGRLKFPEDTRKFTQMKYREFLENKSGNWLVLLAERISENISKKPRAIAFAVWDIPNLSRSQSRSRRRSYGRQRNISSHVAYYFPVLETCQSAHRPVPVTARRDGHAKRMRSWTQTTSSAKAQIFDRRYGRQQFQLQILATHPAFHRQGAATALCGWGLGTARREGMAVSVFASPMGRLLYSRLGFMTLANVTIGVEGEKEYIDLTAMVYVPETAIFIDN